MCNNTHLDRPQRPLLAGAEETLDEPLDGDAAVRFEKVHLREGDVTGERRSRVHNMGERVSRRVYLHTHTSTSNYHGTQGSNRTRVVAND